MLPRVKAKKPANDRTAVRGVAEWMSRSVEAVRADLRFADCGSLDVLLYCPDDVAASTCDPELARPGDEP